MNISPCRPYHAVVDSRRGLDMPCGRGMFKLYFLSIVGRDAPERYEWSRCPLTPDAFSDRFLDTDTAGIGFLTVFPHITKVFVYAPAAETLVNVKAFHTQTFEPIDLGREGGYMEFACYAEAALAADEYAAWAEADTVREYLGYWSPFVEGAIANHAKLAAYWSA